MLDNTAIFLPAKLTSKRLPEKHLLHICGVPIIYKFIERIKDNTKIKKIVLCITDDPIDDKLENIAKKYQIYFHRWKKGAVLQQYIDAADKFKVNRIINIGCDDILVDYNLIDKTASILNITKADYIVWEGYPIGATPLGISISGLKRINQKYNKKDIEHVFAYCENDINITKLTIKESSPILSKSYINDIRLTLDYPEDYEFFNTIYDRIPLKGTISFTELINFIDSNQDIIKINSFRNTDFKLKQQEEIHETNNKNR